MLAPCRSRHRDRCPRVGPSCVIVSASRASRCCSWGASCPSKASTSSCTRSPRSPRPSAFVSRGTARNEAGSAGRPGTRQAPRPRATSPNRRDLRGLGGRRPKRGASARVRCRRGALRPPRRPPDGALRGEGACPPDHRHRSGRDPRTSARPCRLPPRPAERPGGPQPSDPPTAGPARDRVGAQGVTVSVPLGGR